MTTPYLYFWNSSWLQNSDGRLACFCRRKLYNRLKRKPGISLSRKFFGLEYQGQVGNYIERQILCYGAFEKHILYLIRDLLPKKSGTFLDVGCNVGQHSLFAAQLASAVHAFDPFPTVLTKLKRNIQLNNIQNIHIHPVGLGMINSEEIFFMPPEDNQGKGSFVNDFSSVDSGTIPLKMVNGDKYIAKAGIQNISLIKIDVEGYEKYALKGLQQTIAKYRPHIILEVTKNKSLSFANESELRKYLPENYQIRQIVRPKFSKHAGLYSFKPFKWNSFGLQADILCSPVEIQS